MSKMDEQIIVAPRNKVFEEESLTFQGVTYDKELLERVLGNIEINYSVMRRGDAEENFDYKQPIPYAVLRRNDEVFVYERLKGGGETRLHNQLSLGIGGHMNDFPVNNFTELLMENLERELNEELSVEGNREANIIGLINDDVNEVGKVHIGLLAAINLDKDSTVSVRETDQLKGDWVKVKELKKPEVYDNLESWSQFVADILNK